jgi:hypothetical protein
MGWEAVAVKGLAGMETDRAGVTRGRRAEETMANDIKVTLVTKGMR